MSSSASFYRLEIPDEAIINPEILQILNDLTECLHPCIVQECSKVLHQGLSATRKGYEASLEGMILLANTMILVKFLHECPINFRNQVLTSLAIKLKRDTSSVEPIINTYYESSVECCVHRRRAFGDYESPRQVTGAPDGLRTYKWGLDGLSEVQYECKRISRAYRTPERYSKQMIAATQKAIDQFQKRCNDLDKLQIFIDLSLDYACQSDEFQKKCLRHYYSEIKQKYLIQEEQIVLTCFHPSDPRLDWFSFEPRLLRNGLLDRTEFRIGVNMLSILEIYTVPGDPIGIDKLAGYFWDLSVEEDRCT